MRTLIARLPVLLLVTFGIATVAWAFSTGPYGNRTGALAVGAYPAEPLCTACHSSFAANDGNGMVEILDLPAGYVPGDTIPIRVRLTYSAADTTGSSNPKWGFELTAVNAVDGTGIGTLLIPAPGDAPLYPDSLQIVGPKSTAFLSSNRQYIEHTTYSTRTDQPSPVEWQFYWVAPPPEANPGKVYFFVAGNAANGDGSSSGDHIYTGVDSTDVVTVSAPLAGPRTLSLSAPRPNPSRGVTWFDIALARPSAIDLAIFDAQGRRIQTLADGPCGAGAMSVRWDGRAARGRPAANGTYFARLRNGAETQVRRFTLAR